MSDNYTMTGFIENARQIVASSRSEEEILQELTPLAQRICAQPDWRSAEMYYADESVGFGSTLIHEEDNHGLFIVVDSWLPGRGVRPHDHGTWAVVVGLDGEEKNSFWKRIDDGSQAGFAQLELIEERSIGKGEAVTMRQGEIHAVLNETDETTLSFHVYGRHLNHTGRSQFDLKENTEIPFLIETR